MIPDMETSFFTMYAKTVENKGMIKSKQFRSYGKKTFSRILVLAKISFCQLSNKEIFPGM